MGKQQLLGQSAGFRAEHQIDLTRIGHVGVTGAGLGGVVIDFCVGMCSKKSIGILIVAYIQLVPVVKPRAAQMLVVKGKAERMNEMQRCAGDGTGTGNVAGVGVDLRLIQNNVNMVLLMIFMIILIILRGLLK